MSNSFRSFIKNFNSTPVKVEIKKKEKLTISSIPVDEELVEKAFNYLNKIEAPATQATYMAVVRKLIKKEDL